MRRMQWLGQTWESVRCEKPGSPWRRWPAATGLVSAGLLLLAGSAYAVGQSGQRQAPVTTQAEARAKTSSDAQLIQRGDPFTIQLEVLTGGVWVVRRPEPERQPVMGNGVIIDNGDHLVVVDANGSPLLAERVIERIRSISDLPVRTLIITHWHGDHHLGVHRYLEAWPDAELIAHRFTRDAMLGAPMNYLAERRATLPANLAALKPFAEKGQMADGSPAPEALKGDFYDLATYDQLLISELNESRITPPTRVFEDLLVLDDGLRRMELRHFGRGNTAGDAVLWLPDERILVAGDTVAAPTPFGSGSYPRSWARVLERFRGLQPRYLVPGHGPVQEDPQYVEQLIATLETIADRAEFAVDNGVDMETFTRNFDWGALPQRFHRNDPRLRLRFDAWFATPILPAAYREASGQQNEPLVD